jgi:cyclase
MTGSIRPLICWLAAAAAAVAPAAAVAVTAVHGLSDHGARVIQLADSVYVIEHDDATDEWPHGNTGVIIGRSSVFVIDSCYLPSRACADIELIRRITDKPVRSLMTTHWHFDHNNGAIAYKEAFPGVTPTRLFDDRLDLDFEGVRIEIKDRGPANSPNDATIWLPRERVLFAGDLLVHSPLRT